MKDLMENEESVLIVEQEVNYWIGKFRASDYSIPILKFEGYKLNFDTEIRNKVDPLQYLELELKNINEYLENYRHNTKIPKNIDFEFQDYNGKPDKTTTIIDLIYQMTNDNFSINYSFLSQYLQKKLIKPLVLAQIITPIQYKRYLEVIKTDLKATPATPKSPKIEGVEETKVKTFIEYLSHPQREQLAESLKSEFSVEKGKHIKLLIESLKSKSILILGEREMKNLLEAMGKYFNRNIGTYQGINDFKYNKNSHEKDFDSINIRLEKVIKEHEKQENSL